MPELLIAAAALLWLGGALAFLVLNGAARLSFAVLCCRSPSLCDPALARRVAVLGSRVNLHRPVRLFESNRVTGPVAAGVLLPAIGLPPRFTMEYTCEQQDVMFAHELAHLSARDPFWYLLADVLAALLWWHPLAWWARRQLHADSETAADEASQILHDGPRLLAECLVAMGGRLIRQRHAGAISVNGSGFRSSLARRVHRLLDAPPRPWTPPSRAGTALARTLVPTALVVAVIFCAAQTVPQPTSPGDPMKNIAWKHTLPLLALVSTIGAADLPVSAPGTPKPATTTETVPPVNPNEPPRPVPLRAGRLTSPSSGMASATGTSKPTTTPAPVVPLRGAPVKTTPTSEAAAKLMARLDAIVLEEVTYDSLPLSAVIDHLIKESAARDPQKEGVNFLFGQPVVPLRILSIVDPATGLPISAQNFNSDLGSVMIRIIPPLKKVRLSDVLDAIKRVADQPIAYSVEGYAVVFTFDSARINQGNTQQTHEALPEATRTSTMNFTLNTNTFFASLKSMFQLEVDPVPERFCDALRMKVFSKFGVKWNTTESALLYNPLTGVLMVRASDEDTATIRTALETLGGMATSDLRPIIPASATRPVPVR